MFTLNIDNFRGFTKAVSFDIQKINILIGENSGGKSSLIKFLLLLKQSMEVVNKNKKITLDGHLIDLGTFDNIVNYHSKEKAFSFSLITDNEYSKFFMDTMIRNEEVPEAQQSEFQDLCKDFLNKPVTIEFKFNKEDNEVFTNHVAISHETIGTLKIDVCKHHNGPFATMNDISGKLILNHLKKGLIEIDNKLTVYGFMLFANSQIIRNYARDKNDLQLFREFAFLLLTQNYLAHILSNVKYINPIDFKPRRVLLKRDISTNIDIYDYESLVNAFLSLKSSPEVLEQFAQAVHELGIADEIRLEDHPSAPILELKARVGDVWSNITDVGFGVGLQIPILLQALISQHNKDFQQLLIVEQPEIHLHPALHARFIEILVKYANDVNIIIETHSEHIVRKLQVLVKQKIIETANLKIHYFKNSQGKFEISEHNVEANGKLSKPFPKGFYDNSYSLSTELY